MKLYNYDHLLGRFEHPKLKFFYSGHNMDMAELKTPANLDSRLETLFGELRVGFGPAFIKRLGCQLSIIDDKNQFGIYVDKQPESEVISFETAILSAQWFGKNQDFYETNTSKIIMGLEDYYLNVFRKEMMRKNKK